MAKKMEYRGVPFDYFYCYDINGDEVKQARNKKIDMVGTTVCPWCARKYSLYGETGRSAESLDLEISLYECEDTGRYSKIVCGVEGCWNGVAYDIYLNYGDVSISE